MSLRQRFVLFALVLTCSYGSSARAEPLPVPLPRTGQVSCYDNKARRSEVISCAGTGQDGETLTGVPWPEPRFVVKGDPTIGDKLTGLAWTRDADPAGGDKTWQQALDFIKTLNSGKHLGHDDWRLPNVNELESLVNKESGPAAWLSSQGFDNVRKNDYWTSTTYAAYVNSAWSVSMYSGIVAGRGKTDIGRVWPVRTERPATSNLPRTGQTTCSDASGATIACAGTGQDGEIQAGIAWPIPRFTENADRTVTDRLTGLVWSKDGLAPGPPVCMPGTPKTGQGALEYVECLNTHHYMAGNDWRLPNRNELASLVHHGVSNSAAWLNTQGFVNAQAGGYWSSSTYAPTPWNAWGVNMHDGAVTSFAKRHVINVWPVRGGR